jgi:RNA polymerase sigma-70 factor (ECF subfamily)
MPDPETRASLLLRVRDADDQDAWAEFAAIYQPVIRAMATGRGMQSADVDDLVQQVMMAVIGAIDRFELDGQRARFRTWLRTIAYRALSTR